MTSRRDCLGLALGVAACAASPVRPAPRPLELLILGGTGFLGPHMVDNALARGHRVTLFNRGVSAAGPYGHRIEILRGNRDSRIAPGLAALQGRRRWEVVFDNSGYLPRHGRDTSQRLRGRCEQYVFVSTRAVYDFARREVCDETDPTVRLADPASAIETAATYGPLKVECERVLAEAFGADRCTIVRPTYVFGPGDDTERFTYWIERIARGGAMLGPTFPELELQWVDARDLCPWMVRLAESRTRGTFNAAGPREPVSRRRVRESVRTQAGLEYEPLTDAVAATWAWWARQGAERRAAVRGWPAAELEQRALARLAGSSPA